MTGNNYTLCKLQEYEADRIGLMIMSEAGFDPQHILDFMAIRSVKEDEISKRAKVPNEVLRYHPSVRELTCTTLQSAYNFAGKTAPGCAPKTSTGS